MTDQAPHRAMQQGTEAQNAQESTPLRRSAAKDLSLVTLVPKWGGADNAPPLAEFFEAIEGTAKIGNWTEGGGTHRDYDRASGVARKKE